LRATWDVGDYLTDQRATFCNRKLEIKIGGNMKKSLLLITMMLLSAAWVVAQSTSSAQSTGQNGTASSQSSASDQSSQTASSSGMTGETIHGCLSGSAGNYTLTDSATGKTYNLSGDSTDLSAHVGQDIQVKGSAANSSAGMNNQSSNPSSSASSSGTSGAGQSATASETFNVTNVTKISDTCSTK
jgi:hypothetical protein